MNHLTDNQLNEYLDHALDDSARANVDSHLQTCAGCRAKLEELRMLFTELDDLPEARLEHDLTYAVLAHMPLEKPVKTWAWTRALAAQLGVVVGFVLWLGTQIVPLISIPQITLPSLPTIEMWSLVMRLLSLRLPILDFRLSVFNYQIPGIDFQLSTFNMPFSSDQIAMLALSTFLLWVVGNVILLRSRPGVES